VPDSALSGLLPK